MQRDRQGDMYMSIKLCFNILEVYICMEFRKIKVIILCEVNEGRSLWESINFYRIDL